MLTQYNSCQLVTIILPGGSESHTALLAIQIVTLHANRYARKHSLLEQDLHHSNPGQHSETTTPSYLRLAWSLSSPAIVHHGHPCPRRLSATLHYPCGLSLRARHACPDPCRDEAHPKPCEPSALPG